MKWIAYVSLMWAAGCNLASTPDYETLPEHSIISIAGLKSLCDGKASVTVTRNATIRGQVVANDLYGEFDREIVIQDDSGGITIAIEGSTLARKFPFGCRVDVLCNGLVLCDYGGKIGLGAAADEGGCGEIPAEEIERHIRVTDSEAGGPRAVDLAFDQVRSRHIGTRVRFSGVRFAEAGLPWCDSDPQSGRIITTERELVDAEGNRFPVRTLWSCTYAQDPIPEGSGTIIGVIDYFGGRYSLRVTFREYDLSVP